MTINHKLRESIAVGFVIGVLAFVAGAENYYSGTECQHFSDSREAGFTPQKLNARTALRDSTIAVRRSILK